MASAVVSGRVDERIVQEAEAYIRMAGLTPGAVIKTVWENIAKSGEVPQSVEKSGMRGDAWSAFMKAREALPEATWLGSQTDEEMKDMIAGRYA